MSSLYEWNPAGSNIDIRRGTIINAIYRAFQDAKSCVRFFRADAANSNIYKIFPKIFTKGNTKVRLPGFQEFALKLKSLGLTHLTSNQHVLKHSQTGAGSIEKIDLSGQWWYIGE